MIPQYTHLGPPDMVYLVKEQKATLFGAATHSGYYHYVYGVDCSSSASIAVYINSLIKAQEKDGWMKKQKFKIVKATFCIYDPISKTDIRVEVNIPGGTNVYCVNEENLKSPITGIQWNFVFIASVLRSFNPKYSNGIRIVTELETKDSFKDFLLVAGSLHKAGYSNKFVNAEHKQVTNTSYLLSEISKYMIRNRRLSEFIDFINQYTAEDPSLVTFIVDALFSIDRVKDSIILLAENLSEYPMLAPLLVKQVEAFLRFEYYEYGLKIAKICVDLLPESYEAWNGLANTYFHMRQFKESLIALDIAPYYDEAQKNDKFPASDKYSSTNPKKQDSSLFYAALMVEPTKPDFRKLNKENQEMPLLIDTDEERETLEKLNEVNKRVFSASEKKSYELLVQLEKELTWGNLLDMKNDVFFTENEQGTAADNPFLSANFTRTQQTTDTEIAKKKIELKEENILKSELGKPMEEIKELKEESQVTEQAHKPKDKGISARRNKHGYLAEATVEEKIATFVSLPSEPDDEETPDLNKPDKEVLYKKRLANKINNLFMTLYYDLNLLVDWENEENIKAERKDFGLFNYSGLVWVNRGILAERLQRTRLAEKAYRTAIENGFSLFAWYRLLKIYASTYNPKACLVCMAEVLDQAEYDGITHFPKLPYWMEDTLFELISVNGMQRMKQLVQEMQIEDCQPIIDCMLKAQYWRSNG